MDHKHSQHHVGKSGCDINDLTTTFIISLVKSQILFFHIKTATKSCCTMFFKSWISAHTSPFLMSLVPSRYKSNRQTSSAADTQPGPSAHFPSPQSLWTGPELSVCVHEKHVEVHFYDSCLGTVNTYCQNSSTEEVAFSLTRPQNDSFWL